jgi:hypothetical protein
MAYGINVQDSTKRNGNKFDDPFAFDDYDLWFG